jgi:hypothetical protein
MIATLAPLVLLAAVPITPGDDPLAPARAGQIQCTMPDPVKRTCFAMTRYLPVSETVIRSLTRFIVSPEPAISVEMAADGMIEDGAVCGTLRREDVASARVFVGTAQMSAGDAAPMVEHLLTGTVDGFGKKICTRFSVDGDMMVADATIDGVARPDMRLKFMWVKPEDGYVLGV